MKVLYFYVTNYNLVKNNVIIKVVYKYLKKMKEIYINGGVVAQATINIITEMNFCRTKRSETTAAQTTATSKMMVISLDLPPPL